MFGVDGLVISEEGFGNPDADLIMNCRRAEMAGIKTVLITDEFAGRDGASQSLADAAAEANAVVTAGNANMIVTLLPMQRLIGYDEYANVIAGGFDGSLKPDGSIEVELQAITGATCELGFNRLGAETW
jgi:glycine reductase